MHDKATAHAHSPRLRPRLPGQWRQPDREIPGATESAQQSSRCYPLVNQKTDGRRLANGTDSAGQSALKVLACAGLVSEIMKDDASHAIGGAQSNRIAGDRGKGR
jgi:hypothetical protein